MSAREPRGIEAFIDFFAPRWASETPTKLHIPEVWHAQGANVPKHLQGGSLLGTPAHHEAFRRLLEGSSWETDKDGMYVRPCRAALQRMINEGKVHTAGRMVRLARSGWAADTIIADDGLAREDGLVLLLYGLRRWWRLFEEKPTRPL